MGEMIIMIFSRILASDLTDEEMCANLDSDWAGDTHDESGTAKFITRNQFLWSIFEIVDQWLDNVDCTAYVNFLETIRIVVSHRNFSPVEVELTPRPQLEKDPTYVREKELV